MYECATIAQALASQFLSTQYHIILAYALNTADSMEASLS